ncbi:MAG: radical SAM protein [Candidatus Krumholzibacteriota bacterium]|nr:radical SAM protein [Candidatus Krumholzibacteriota bacterium]
MKIEFNKLIIDKAADNDPLTHKLRKKLPEADVEVVSDIKPFVGKKRSRAGLLVITRHKGKFIKDFPEASGTPPCGEKYITTLLNCPFSCSYCYLQSYLEHSQIVVFSNTEDMKEELKSVLAADPPPRITTGEMGDSLAIDHLTETTADLLPLFKESRTLLEVRTKSANIDHLFCASEGNLPVASAAKGADRLLVTWTLTPPEAIRKEEKGAETLEKRLDAINRISRAGVKVAVRFDPLIPSYFTFGRYEKIAEKLKEAAENGIHRFEIGVLRFPPGLWKNVRLKYPESAIMRGEYHRDIEGKMRLYRPERVKIYRKLHLILSDYFPDVPVELSMEHESVWKDAGIELPA